TASRRAPVSVFAGQPNAGRPPSRATTDGRTRSKPRLAHSSGSASVSGTVSTPAPVYRASTQLVVPKSMPYATVMAAPRFARCAHAGRGHRRAGQYGPSASTGKFLHAGTRKKFPADAVD